MIGMSKCDIAQSYKKKLIYKTMERLLIYAIFFIAKITVI